MKSCPSQYWHLRGNSPRETLMFTNDWPLISFKTWYVILVNLYSPHLETAPCAHWALQQEVSITHFLLRTGFPLLVEDSCEFGPLYIHSWKFQMQCKAEHIKAYGYLDSSDSWIFSHRRSDSRHHNRGTEIPPPTDLYSKRGRSDRERYHWKAIVLSLQRMLTTVCNMSRAITKSRVQVNTVMYVYVATVGDQSALQVYGRAHTFVLLTARIHKGPECYWCLW